MLSKDYIAAALKMFVTQVEELRYVSDGTAIVDKNNRILSRDEATQLLNDHLEFLDAFGDDNVEKANELFARPDYSGVSANYMASLIPGISRGFAYVMHNPSNGLYKLGRSIDPQHRVSGVRKDEDCVSIYVVHQIKTDDCIWLEEKLHILFASWRKHGEWFALQPEDIAWLKAKAEWNRHPAATRLMDSFSVRPPTPDLYSEAVALAQRQGKVSISMLQRTLKIGYTGAARLIEQMEADGIVLPRVDGQQWRDVACAALAQTKE